MYWSKYKYCTFTRFPDEVNKFTGKTEKIQKVHSHPSGSNNGIIFLYTINQNRGE